MGVSLINYYGVSFSEGKITEITVKNSTKSSTTSIPGLDKDYILRMNKTIREFSLSGYVTGSDGIWFLGASLNNTGSFYYTSSAFGGDMIGTATAPVTVFYENLQMKDVSGKPMQRDFDLTLLEVKT